MTHIQTSLLRTVVLSLEPCAVLLCQSILVQCACAHSSIRMLICPTNRPSPGTGFSDP